MLEPDPGSSARSQDASSGTLGTSPADVSPATAVDEGVTVHVPDVEPRPSGEGREVRPVLRVDEARRRALRPWAIAGVGAVVAAVAVVALVASPVFDADTIIVSGERHLSEAKVRRIAGIDHDTNVVRLDEGTVERRLARDPWILRATVSAELPTTIRIVLVERTPVAVATTASGRSFVSADGTVLGVAPIGSALPEIRPAEPSAAPTAPQDPAVTGAAQNEPAATTGSATPVDDATVEQGAKVAGSLTPGLRGVVVAVEIGADGSLTLELESGVPVAYGDASELAAKAEALSAILNYARGEPTPLISIDVSTPAAPTARFVGTSVTNPQPEGNQTEKDRQDEAVSDASSSPSPSP